MFKPSARVDAAGSHQERLGASPVANETISIHVSCATTLQLCNSSGVAGKARMLHARELKRMCPV
jgi:hypothetical protein